jgi:hypothetical protein
MNHRTTIAVLAAAGLAGTAFGSNEILAQWVWATAEDRPVPIGTPASSSYSVGEALVGVMTEGTNLFGVHTNSETFWTSPAGNGSLFSFSSNRWTTGDYYQANVSTVGYENIAFSFDQARNAAIGADTAFSLRMSIDEGDTWITLIDSYAVLQAGGGGSPGTWSATAPRDTQYSIGVENIALAADQASVWFRMQLLTAPGTDSGLSRLDWITLEGTLIPAPGAIALLALAGLAGSRRRR